MKNYKDTFLGDAQLYGSVVIRQSVKILSWASVCYSDLPSSAGDIFVTRVHWRLPLANQLTSS